MVILKRIFGGKFSVFVVNPDNVCFNYLELEMLYLPLNMDNLSYKEAKKLCKKLKSVLKKLGLKPVIK